MSPRAVIEMLFLHGALTLGQDDEIMGRLQAGRQGIFQVLAEMGILRSEAEFWAITAAAFGFPYFDLSIHQPAADVLQLIPPFMARLLGVFPIDLASDGLHIAFVDVTELQNTGKIEDISFGLPLGLDIVPVVAQPLHVKALIEKHYPADSDITPLTPPTFPQCP